LKSAFNDEQHLDDHTRYKASLRLSDIGLLINRQMCVNDRRCDGW